MKDNEASCACGAVLCQFNIAALNVVNCHCNMCRQHNGTPFSTYVVFPLGGLNFEKGNDAIHSFRMNTAEKHFCKNCGTPIYNTNEKYAGLGMVYLGALRNPDDYIPKANIWCESKLLWVENSSNIRSFPQGVNG